MRVSRQAVAENRERMLKAASRLFRENGFTGVGVDDLAREAGLSYGTLYSQFGSKEGLAAAAVSTSLGESAANWRLVAGAERAAGGDPFAALVELYLSPEHRDRPGGGCMLSTLAVEAPRTGDVVQESFAGGAEGLLEILTEEASGDDPAARRQVALGALSAMVGGMVLARTLKDEAASADVLAAARRTALAARDCAGQGITGDTVAAEELPHVC